jgi:1-acyl-sn-glycerol-3-phosphate acyltransferase
MIIGLAWLPITLFVKSTHIVARLGIIWASVSIALLRVICGIKVQIIGFENVPKTPCIIASKHESAWETIFFFKLFVEPVFILKAELTKIPFYGWHLKAMGMICIDRADGMTSIKQAVAGAAKTFDSARYLVIFPEGTRTVHGTVGDIKSGIVAIHNKFPSVPIVPVALDSGLYWSNRSWIKKPGTITLRFKPPINGPRSKAELVQSLTAGLQSL